METYIILSRFAPDAFEDPHEIKDLARKVREEIKRRCPEVEWRESYATLGRFDVIDVVQSGNRQQVEQAALIIQAYGHARVETLVATPWKQFLERL